MRQQILILGGTSEAAELARRLATEPDRFAVTTSLAGRTASPVAPPGSLRIGGFGGAAGLADALRSGGFDALIDATHPFAAVMPWNAAGAAEATGIPFFRVERPPWRPAAGDNWTSVPDLAAAAAALGDVKRVFLTTGRQDLAPFSLRQDVWYLLRSIDPPGPLPFSLAEVVLAKAPFTCAEEERLMARFDIEALVTKNSGAEATAAKLEAARRLAIRVIMVERPAKPPGLSLPTVQAALDWLDAGFPRRCGTGTLAGATAA